MTEFYELCLRNTSEEMKDFSEELGWRATNCEFETVFLEADDWGELKRKIGEKRETADVLVFRGGDAELNRKAVEDSRVDVLLHPGRGRKDSGLDHVMAEEAAKNRVAIGFDLSQLMKDSKSQSHVINTWMENLKLCEKYSSPYIITSAAQNKLDMRSPEDLASIIESLGFNGKNAVSSYPKEILDRSQKVDEEGFVRPGEEVRNDE